MLTILAVFIIDRSGSMNGEPFLQAKQAFQWALKNLRPGDRFNAILFDDLQEEFAPGEQLVPVSDQSVVAASQWIDRYSARGLTGM